MKVGVLVVGMGLDDGGVEVAGVALIVVGVGDVTVPDPVPELEEDVVVEVPEPLGLGVVLDEVLEPVGNAVLVGAPPVVVGELEDGSVPVGCRTVGSVCVWSRPGKVVLLGVSVALVGAGVPVLGVVLVVVVVVALAVLLGGAPGLAPASAGWAVSWLRTVVLWRSTCVASGATGVGWAGATRIAATASAG